MPTMFEIYDHHADRYDELVGAEDWQGNFARVLLQIADWRGARALEAGVGSAVVIPEWTGLWTRRIA